MSDRRITEVVASAPKLGEPYLKSQTYILELSPRDVVALSKTRLIDRLGVKADEALPGAMIQYIQHEEFLLTIPFNRKSPASPALLAKIIADEVQAAYDMLILHVA